MLLVYLIDQQSIHHHRYWFHVPLFRFIAANIVLPALWRSALRGAALAFFAAILLDLLLDSIGGGMMWLAPFNTALWEFVTVPAHLSHWVLSSIQHWTFTFELMIWAAAGYLYITERKRSAQG